MNLSTCIGVLALAITAPALAQHIPTFSALLAEQEDTINPPRTAGNAAWDYIRVWDTLPTDQEARIRFNEAMGERPKPGEKLSKLQREQLSLQRDVLEGVMLASSVEHCDWGPRLDEGLMSQLPHLGQLRNSARALALDARRCAEDGSSAAAAERIVAMFRMSRHASTDTIVISSLVGIAIGNFAATVTDELIRQGDITPAAARSIRQALRQAQTGDLYNSAAAIETERHLVVDWFRRECKGPDAGKFLVRHLSVLGSMRETGLDAREVLFFMDEAAVAAGLDRAERYYDAVRVAWHKPEPMGALAELDLEAAEGQFGLVTAAIAGSFARVRYPCENVRRVFERLDRRLSTIIEQADAAPKE